MAGRLLRLFVLVLLVVIGTTSAHAQNRIALVIGNSAYQHAGVLPNPRRDAELMARTLTGAGFEVQSVLDADQTVMKRALVEFGRKLRDSKAVGLFYYAGHGLQVGGRNYLVPTSASIQDETEVGIESVALDEFLATMERPGSPVNIVVLDACRNNPFPRAFRSSGGGLARSDAPSGTFLAYATAPGAVAADGAGDNSPYTAALVRAMSERGLALEEVFKQTRREVLAETKGAQVPWESSSITGNFYFSGGPESRPASKPPADSGAEVAFWNSMKDSVNPAAFEAYLSQFPSGTFVSLARLKIASLKPPPPPAPAAPPAAQPGAEPPPSQYRPMFAHSGSRELAESDVASLSCAQLWVARNEMFHRHGYCFATPAAQQYFGSAGCRTTRQDVLNAAEKTNFRLIRAQEIRRQCDAAAAPVQQAAVRATQPAPAPARPVNPPATGVGAECDRLAGASFDADLSGFARGVDFRALDAARAINACSQAVQENPAVRRFAFALGRALDKARDYGAARTAYERAARQGSAAAMINIGILYEKGQGVARNGQEARGYYDRAARAGSQLGAFCYATALDNGIGGVPDPGKAREWYLKAAELGHPTARSIAGRLASRPQPTGTKCD